MIRVGKPVDVQRVCAVMLSIIKGVACPRGLMVWIGLLVAWCPSAPVLADVTTFERAGGWEAFGGRTDRGDRLCGISANGGGRFLGIKYFEGDSAVTIQLSKTTWRVRDGVRVEVLMQFDNESPWRAYATSFHMGYGDAALQFEIGSNQIGQWTEEFQRGNTLYVRFPQEEEIGDWQADLSGTEKVTRAWALCILAMRQTE